MVAVISIVTGLAFCFLLAEVRAMNIQIFDLIEESRKREGEIKFIKARLVELEYTDRALKYAEKALEEKEEEIKKLEIENKFYKGMLF